MAARNRLTHDAKTREKIQTSMLVNRLQNFVEGKVELSPAQVTAALGLIKKTLPDLSSVEAKVDATLSYEDRLKQLANV